MKKVRMPNLAGHLNLPFQKNGADRNRFNIHPTISKKHLWIKECVLIGVSTTKGMAILMSICF